MKIPQDTIEKLIKNAVAARQFAYAPYSHFCVGAAILGCDGQFYLGSNVENASYGLTICAERNAVGAMVIGGCREIAAIAISLEGDGSPCGACRQVLAEFGQQFSVLLVDPAGQRIAHQWTIDQLLPDAFRLNQH